jgi:hypothetical protein
VRALPHPENDFSGKIHTRRKNFFASVELKQFPCVKGLSSL